jgi:hypothetical protein
MSATEICLIVIAACLVALTTITVVFLVRLIAIARALDTLSTEGRALVQRLHGVTGEVEGMIADARRVEERAVGLVHGTIDRLEPPLRQLTAVITGVSAAVASFARLVPGLSRTDVARPDEPPPPRNPSL